MEHFRRIALALETIDANLDQPMSMEKLARIAHLSPYYFHRLFSAVVGRTLAAYIRSRRLERACRLLAETDRTVLSICLECGFDSAPSFSRSFRGEFGLSPTEYRRQGFRPSSTTVEEMIIHFTNRLRGGTLMDPNMIKKNKLVVAGVSGDGYKTAEVWQAFEMLHAKTPLTNRLSDNGYEVRLWSNEEGTVHVGYAVENNDVPEGYTALTLPATRYASFDVYVARGYDSENDAIHQWLDTNKEGYSQRTLDGAYYVVEYYDERFHGEESGSIVEIWIPVEQK